MTRLEGEGKTAMLAGREGKLIGTALFAGSAGTAAVTKTLFAELIWISARNPAWPVVLIGLCGAIAALGCGLATYEERLKETSDYFAYHQMLNENLSKQVWSGSILAQVINQEQVGGEAQWVPVQVGITMRVPLGQDGFRYLSPTNEIWEYDCWESQEVRPSVVNGTAGLQGVQP